MSGGGVSKNGDFSPQNEFMNWFGTVEASGSEETAASNDSTSEEGGGFQDKPGVSHLQPDHPTSSGQASSTSMSTSASDGFQSGSGQQWTRPYAPQRDVVHIFKGS